jgi:hypothetical protein
MGLGLKRWTGMVENTEEREKKREDVRSEDPLSLSCYVLADYCSIPERLVNACVIGELLVRVYETGVYIDEISAGRVLARHRLREGVITAACSYLQAEKLYLVLVQALPSANRLLKLRLEAENPSIDLESYFFPELKGRSGLFFEMCTDLPYFSQQFTIISLSFSVISTSFILANAKKLYLLPSSLPISLTKLRPFKHKSILAMQLYQRLNYLFISAKDMVTSQDLVCIWDLNSLIPLLEVWTPINTPIVSISIVPCLKITGKVVILGLTAASDLLVMELIPVPLEVIYRASCRLEHQSHIFAERYGQMDSIYLLSSTSLVYFDKKDVLPCAIGCIWQAPVLSSESDASLKSHIEACIASLAPQGGEGLLADVNRLLEEYQLPDYCPPSPSEQCSPLV